MKTVVLLAAAFALSLVLTGLLRRYALRVNMLDIPNERSSHTAPTPRGRRPGGCTGFPAGCTSSDLARVDFHPTWRWFSFRHACSSPLSAGWMITIPFRPGSGSVFICSPALQGFIFSAACPTCRWSHEHIMLGTWSYILIAPALVWAINLHNFMDGIDGIASVRQCLSRPGQR